MPAQRHPLEVHACCQAVCQMIILLTLTITGPSYRQRTLTWEPAQEPCALPHWAPLDASALSPVQRTRVSFSKAAHTRDTTGGKLSPSSSSKPAPPTLGVCVTLAGRRHHDDSSSLGPLRLAMARVSTFALLSISTTTLQTSFRSTSAVSACLPHLSRTSRCPLILRRAFPTRLSCAAMSH